MPNTVLIIDDDPELCTLMKKCALQEKLEANIAHTGRDGLTKMAGQPDAYCLIILDVMLPGMDGFQVLSEIRKTSTVPVLMLTAKGDEIDKVTGLRLGADDYLTKPFSINELMARMESLIRRYTTFNQTMPPDVLSFKNMRIEKDTRTVYVQGEPVDLTGKEFDLLVFLAAHKGRVYTKKQIYTQVWEDEYAFDDNNIMSYISKLRKKIEPDAELMNWALIFLGTTVLCIGIFIYLGARLHRVKQQLGMINDALEDIQQGNLNRRVLTRQNDLTNTICYRINEIAINDQARMIRLRQSEQSYKRLMMGLSHDVKTPLTSLVGYLEAIQEKIVTGEEKEEYIGVALDKAHHLKDFVESLFEWVKLDAKEEIFQFEIYDLNELSRDILADWIPALEDQQFTYEIDIPDGEYCMRLDRNAYTRILNNLLQNALAHSGGDKIGIRIEEDEAQARIMVSDNGRGIADQDLPHIFERLYQGDESRSSSGNGLGLSIVQELVAVHNGTIQAGAPPTSGTTFTITLPKAL